METNSQHYTKIEIKGDKGNLPKNCGNYFVMSKTGDGGFRHFPFFGDVGYNNFVYDWLTNIDWYLLPVPEPQQQEQPENADLKQYITNLLYYAYSHERDDSKFDEWVEAEIDHIDGFFASQSHNNTVVGPSEESIMTYFNLHCGQMADGYGIPIPIMRRSQVLDVVKYALSQCKAVDLRATLIKFCEDIGYDYTDTDNLNEFLKSPENK